MGARVRLVSVPVSLGAHVVGLAAILALPAIGTPDLPDPRSTTVIEAWSVPTIRLFRPPAAARARRGSSGGGGAPRAQPSPPAIATVDVPPLPILVDDGRPGGIEADASGCVGCVIGAVEPGGGDRLGGAATAGGAEPVRPGGQIRAPVKLRHVEPVYPEIARRARVQGVVVLECTLDPQGRVANLRVLRGVPLLDAAAVEAVQQWRFTPTLLNDVPVPVIMTVTVTFELR